MMSLQKRSTNTTLCISLSKNFERNSAIRSGKKF
jgi:hypothetical protein